MCPQIMAGMAVINPPQTKERIPRTRLQVALGAFGSDGAGTKGNGGDATGGTGTGVGAEDGTTGVGSAGGVSGKGGGVGGVVSSLISPF